LVRLFDDHLVEAQEEYGIQVVGQFRDLDRPDRFVWIRAFESPKARTAALQGFYSGAVWRTHADAAGAAAAEAGDVLLLRPAGAGCGFEHDPRRRPGRTDPERRGEGGFVVANIHHVAAPARDAFVARFRAEVVPALEVTGTPVAAQLVDAEGPDDGSPRLPGSAGVSAFVWLAAYPDRATERASTRMLARLLGGLRLLTRAAPERLLLAPTRRSALRYRPVSAPARRSRRAMSWA
jgi:hypothetical protein